MNPRTEAATAVPRSSRTKSVDTLANRVTAARLVLAFVLFVVLERFARARPDAATGPALLALVLFVLAAATDALDGWLARSRSESTALGRVADPFVDKVLVCGAFVFLAVAPTTGHLVRPWIVAVVLAREFLSTTLRAVVESKGGAFPADAFGKAKMLVQCLTIGFVLGVPAVGETFLGPLARWGSPVLVSGTVLVTALSGATYLYRARSALLGGGNP